MSAAFHAGAETSEPKTRYEAQSCSTQKVGFSKWRPFFDSMRFSPSPLPSGGFLKKPADKILIFLPKNTYFIIKTLNLHHCLTPNLFLVDMDHFDTVTCLLERQEYS